MAGTSATLSASALKKAIDRYYNELHEYQGKADYELAVRTAFINLLAETARQVKWTLIPEQTIEGNIRPDGVSRDGYDLKRGFWGAKGPTCSLSSSPTPSRISPLSRQPCRNSRSASPNWPRHCWRLS